MFTVDVLSKRYWPNTGSDFAFSLLDAEANVVTGEEVVDALPHRGPQHPQQHRDVDHERQSDRHEQDQPQQRHNHLSQSLPVF